MKRLDRSTAGKLASALAIIALLIAACTPAPSAAKAHLSVDGKPQSLSSVMCAPRHQFVRLDLFSFYWHGNAGQAAYQTLGYKTSSHFTGPLNVKADAGDALALHFTGDLGETFAGGAMGGNAVPTVHITGDVHCQSTDNGVVSFASPTIGGAYLQVDVPDDSSRVDRLAYADIHQTCGQFQNLTFGITTGALPLNGSTFSQSGTTKVLGGPPAQVLPAAKYQLDGLVQPNTVSVQLHLTFPGCDYSRSWSLTLQA